MKKFLILAALILFTANAEAANRYARGVGGNWTDNATWSTTSGGAADTVAPTASDDVFLDANSGQVTISAVSVGKSLTCTGYTGTLTHNAFDLTISGNITLVSGMTYTPASASSRLRFLAAGTFTSGGKTPWSVAVLSVNVTLGDNLTFINQKTTLLNIVTPGTLILNGFTVAGNSATNRVLIQSNTLGTAVTITNTTGTFANADFRDITFSTVADYSGITGNSGDCGGNTNGTFTTAATQTYTGGTGSWSDVTKWTSRVPLPQDNVLMSGVTGGTITADMPRLGKSIDWTGASGSPTWAVSTAGTWYGSLTLISGMTLTQTTTMFAEGRGSFTLTSAGRTFAASMEIVMIGGTMTLQDAYINTNVGNGLLIRNGTFVDNGMSITTAITNSSNANTRAITKTGNWTVTGTGTVWNYGTTTGLTFSDTGTITLSDTSASSKTFAGGGLTYNNLSISGGGAGAVIITGANTFASIECVGPKTITFPSATTTTVSNWLIAGSSGAVITVNASSTTQASVSKPSGTVASNYLLLNSSNATGGATFYAGTNSTVNDASNTGWIFTNAPVVAGGSIASYMLTQGWI